MSRPLVLLVAVCLASGTARAQDAESLAAFLETSEPALDGVLDEVARLSGAAPLPSGETIVSRSVHHPDLRLAEDHVVATLSALPGVTVFTEEVEGVDSVGGETVTIPGLRNIIGEIEGADPSLGAVVLSAHLDSTASAEAGWVPGTDPAPGADDDASGVAAVLAAARAFSSWEPGSLRTVRFVLFTAEEIGLQGSFAHVDGLVERGEEPSLVLQLDPVGFNGGDADRLWFSYDARWDESPGLVGAAAEERGTWLTVQGVDRALLGGQAERSDHFPFWEAGMRAIHFGAFPPPPDYHKTTDTIDGVDGAFLAEVAAVVLHLAAEHAEPLPVQEDPVCTDACCCTASATPPSLAGAALFLVALAGMARRRR